MFAILSKKTSSLIDDAWAIQRKYLAPYQIPTFSGKPRAYYEVVMTSSESMNICYTIEDSKDPFSAIIYSKCIIKKIIKPDSWGFDLTTFKVIKIMRLPIIIIIGTTSIDFIMCSYIRTQRINILDFLSYATKLFYLEKSHHVFMIDDSYMAMF